MESSNHIVVVGLGVIGLPTALLLASSNYQVVGVDINKSVIKSLKNGVLPSHIREKELQVLLKDSKVRENLKFQDIPTKANTFIITVPTPLAKKKKKADLSFVKKALDSIRPFLKKGDLLIIESTIPPKTCRDFVIPILETDRFKVGQDIFLAHCPERVLPGNIYYEIVNNDRIIGGVDKKSSDLAEKIYKSFVKGKIYKTDAVSAELCKLMENAYRDVNIALANEFAMVAGNLGIDPKKVINLANKHPRVNILNPGIGVGGHCIPIDPWFIYEVDPTNSRLIETSRTINDQMPYVIANRIVNEVKHIKDPQIVVVGASYKADTGDTRESPAAEVIKILKQMSMDISHFDPLVDEYKYPFTLLKRCSGKDLLVILVPHQVVIKELDKDEEKIKKVLSTHQILQF